MRARNQWTRHSDVFWFRPIVSDQISPEFSRDVVVDSFERVVMSLMTVEILYL
jgi:hypothetical protein